MATCHPWTKSINQQLHWFIFCQDSCETNAKHTFPDNSKISSCTPPLGTMQINEKPTLFSQTKRGVREQIRRLAEKTRKTQEIMQFHSLLNTFLDVSLQ